MKIFGINLMEFFVFGLGCVLFIVWIIIKGEEDE